MSIRNFRSTEEVESIFQNNGCRLISKYINTATPLEYICVCGSKSKILLCNFLIGVRCKACGIKKRSVNRRHNIKYIQQVFAENNCILLEAEYKNNRTPMQYICKCGKQNLITFSHFKEGKRCRKCGNQRISKENHYRWLSEEERKSRSDRSALMTLTCEWRLKIYEKDHYTCQRCLKRGKNLVAHHLNAWNKFPEQRFDTKNGVTLCRFCHLKFHKKYGFGSNDANQFQEWMLEIK